GLEPLHATRAAEIVGLPFVVGRAASGGRIHIHVADRIFDGAFFEIHISCDLSGHAGKRVLSVRHTCAAPAWGRPSEAPQWRSAANGLSSGYVLRRATTRGWQTSAPERPGSSVPLPPFSGRRGPGLQRGAAEAAGPAGPRL